MTATRVCVWGKTVQFRLASMISLASFVSFYILASCPMPLGMVSGEISNDQVKASSWLDTEHTPGHARVGNYSSWRPEPTDADPWLEIGFKERMLITGLLIQGGGQEEHNWVKTLNLRFGDGYSWFWTYNEYKKLEIRAAVSICRSPPPKSSYCLTVNQIVLND